MTVSVRPKILVVEDDAAFRDSLVEWLGMDGYEVQAAGDGVEALEFASWDVFDAVVTDLKMPRLDGLGLLARLKAISPEAQVIFLSGEATKSDVIEAMREGRSFDFLEKPLMDMSRLSRAIARALAARQPAPPAAPPPPPAAPVGEYKHPALSAVFAFIDANLSEAISLRHVADAVGYSPTYLTTLVRQETGLAVTQWIAELRVKRAKALLESTEASIVAVGRQVGFQDAGYFARVFRKLTGEAPQAWREHARQGTVADA